MAHRAVINRGVQIIALPRHPQVGIKYQGRNELLTQRVFLGIHAVISKDLKAVDSNAVGMAQIVIAHVGNRRRGGDIAPATAGQFGPFDLGCVLG